MSRERALSSRGPRSQQLLDAISAEDDLNHKKSSIHPLDLGHAVPDDSVTSASAESDDTRPISASASTITGTCSNTNADRPPIEVRLNSRWCHHDSSPTYQERVRSAWAASSTRKDEGLTTPTAASPVVDDKRDQTTELLDASECRLLHR